MERLQSVSWQHHQGQLCKKKLPPLITKNLTTNTQAFDASIKVSYLDKAEEINNISCRTVVTIEVQVIRTDDPMVVLREKGMKNHQGTLFFKL